MKNHGIHLLLAMQLLVACGEKESSKRFGGVTLYTVRDQMKADPMNTLQVLSDIGYKHIEEAAGYTDGKFFGMAPDEFKTTLNGLDLIPISTHQPSVTLDNADRLISDVKAAGFQYFVIPIPPMGHFKYDPETRTMSMTDSLQLITEVLNTVGKKCSEAGLELLYHNHDFEFKPNANGVVPIDYFLENTDPNYVNFQMDLYWVTKAEADPLAYFERYPGRFKAWHVKDMDEEGKFAPVGKGTIDFGKILEQKELSGMEFYIVEQDNTFDLDPLEAVRISYGGLKSFGFN